MYRSMIIVLCNTISIKVGTSSKNSIVVQILCNKNKNVSKCEISIVVNILFDVCKLVLVNQKFLCPNLLFLQ